MRCIGNHSATAPLSRIGLLRAGFAESECRDLQYLQCDARQTTSLQSAPAVGDLADYRHSLPVRVELVDVEDFELGSPAHDIDLNLATTIGYQPKSECLGCLNKSEFIGRRRLHQRSNVTGHA